MAVKSDILRHYTKYWHGEYHLLTFDRGPVHALPGGFCVAEFNCGPTWRYATVGMSSTTSTRPADAEGLEAFLVTREPHRRCVELLYFLAYYHLNDSKLSMGDSVNFGMPVWADSQLDHAVLSFPYIEQDGFAELRGGGRHSMISWIVPITKAEREYKKANGLDALEDALEHNQVDYLNPNRAQVI